eukprot:60459-Pyramimonas_sp.AAC.1
MHDSKGPADRPWLACCRAAAPATQTCPGSIASRARDANERLQQQGLKAPRLAVFRIEESLQAVAHPVVACVH